MKRILALNSQPDPTSAVPAARRTLIAHPWRYAAATAAVALAVLLLATLRGGSSNAFAQVMEQIRMVTACTYTLTVVKDGTPETQFKTYYEEPGKMRMDASTPGGVTTAVSIVDLNRKKLITLMPRTKQCLTFDLTGDTAHSPQASTANLFEELRRIPDSGAQPIGTKKIHGVDAIGFRASQGGMSYTIWADPTDKHVLLIEYESENIKGMNGQLSDFDFEAKLDDSLFSLEPPPGYTVVDGKSLKIEKPSEETFIRFLRTWAEETKGNLFLPSLDETGLIEAARSRKKTAPKLPASMSPEFLKRTQQATLGLMFVMQMTPENDFHYAGKGVALGDAKSPICWYKPTGEKNYHVIYGDLTVREVPPKDVPLPPA